MYLNIIMLCRGMRQVFKLDIVTKKLKIAHKIAVS